MGKLVPQSLTTQPKLTRKQIFQHHLNLSKKNETKFVLRFVTMNESWIFPHDPKLKQERSLVVELQNRLMSKHWQKRLWRQFEDANGILSYL